MQNTPHEAAADYRAALAARPADPDAIAAATASALRHRRLVDYVATLHRHDLPPAAAPFAAPAIASPLDLLRRAARATRCQILRRIPSPHIAAAMTPTGRLTVTASHDPAPPDPLAIDDAQAHATARRYRAALRRPGAPEMPATRADLRALDRLLQYSAEWHPANGLPIIRPIMAPAAATTPQIVRRAKIALAMTGRPLRSPYESEIAIASASAAGTLIIRPDPRPAPAPPAEIGDDEV